MANTSIKLETSGSGPELEGAKIQILGSPQQIPISLSGTSNVSGQQLNVSGQQLNVSGQQLNVSGGNISAISGAFKPDATSSPTIQGLQPQLIQAGGPILTTAGGQIIQGPNGMLQVVQAVSEEYSRAFKIQI